MKVADLWACVAKILVLCLYDSRRTLSRLPVDLGAKGFTVLSSQTALHIAVILGASDFVGKLVSAGAGLCVQEKGGHTALHLACREGQRECAQQLLMPALVPRPFEGSGFKAQLDCTNYDGTFSAPVLHPPP